MVDKNLKFKKKNIIYGFYFSCIYIQFAQLKQSY